MPGPSPENARLIASAKNDAIEVAARTVMNVIRDLYDNSRAKAEGKTFDEFCAARQSLAKFNPTPKYQLTVADVKQGLAETISSSIRPLTFAAYDTAEAINKAANKAANDVADNVLRSLGFK